MKRLVLAIMLIATFFTSPFGIAAEHTVRENRLSALSDDACLEFLKENGVTIPNIYEYEAQCIPFIRLVIDQVEENPCAMFEFSMPQLKIFAYEIKKVVNDYYGMTVETSRSSRTGYVLQDSEVYGDWSDSFLNFNCYAYAIGYSDAITPGEIAWKHDSTNEGSYQYNATEKLLLIASRVRNDLETLGYAVELPTTIKPNTKVTAHSYLICFRRDNDVTYDFHFMKLGPDDKWYHKPGAHSILKYKYEPIETRVWLCEGYDGRNDTFFNVTNCTYDSVIFYIEYTTPHEWDYVYCSDNRHIQMCTICEATMGEAIRCTYLNNVCKFCGHYNGYVDLEGRIAG